MKPALLCLLMCSAALAKPIYTAKASVPSPAPACESAGQTSGFTFTAPGLEDLVNLGPTESRRCQESAALAAQHYGEQAQAAFRNAWPRVGPAILATVERVNLPSPTPALVKFCFVGTTAFGGKNIACGEVVYKVAEGTIELKLAGREAVTSAARVPDSQDPPAAR